MTTNVKTLQWWGILLAAITCEDWHSSVSWCLRRGHVIYRLLLHPIAEFILYHPTPFSVSQFHTSWSSCDLSFLLKSSQLARVYRSISHSLTILLSPSVPPSDWQQVSGCEKSPRITFLLQCRVLLELNFSIFCALRGDQISLCAHSSFDYNDLNTWTFHQHQPGL